MSTRERVVGLIDDLTEEQLEAIAVILSGMTAKSPRKKHLRSKAFCIGLQILI